MSSQVEVYANATIIALAAAGCFCAWKFIFTREARLRRPVGVPEWPGTAVNFLLFIWVVVCGGLLGQLIGLGLTRAFPVRESAQLIFLSAAFQFGMLAALGTFNFNWAGSLPHLRLDRFALRGGAVVFLLAMPMLIILGQASEALLRALHIPIEKQALVEMLAHERSPQLIIALIIVATVVAPVVEELIFRAGLFRFMSTRFPRWASHLLPAVLFGLLHGNLVSFAFLTALGLLFSLAYERTGRIETTMVAHGLFNLFSTVGVLLGLDST